MQQRLQCLKEALSDVASQLQLVRQQFVEHEQQDQMLLRNRKSREPAWQDVNVPYGTKRLQRRSSRNCGNNLNATLWTSYAREQEDFLQWKPEPAV